MRGVLSVFGRYVSPNYFAILSVMHTMRSKSLIRSRIFHTGGSREGPPTHPYPLPLGRGGLGDPLHSSTLGCQPWVGSTWEIPLHPNPHIFQVPEIGFLQQRYKAGDRSPEDRLRSAEGGRGKLLEGWNFMLVSPFYSKKKIQPSDGPPRLKQPAGILSVVSINSAMQQFSKLITCTWRLLKSVSGWTGHCLNMDPGPKKQNTPSEKIEVERTMTVKQDKGCETQYHRNHTCKESARILKSKYPGSQPSNTKLHFQRAGFGFAVFANSLQITDNRVCEIGSNTDTFQWPMATRRPLKNKKAL